MIEMVPNTYDFACNAWCIFCKVHLDLIGKFEGNPNVVVLSHSFRDDSFHNKNQRPDKY